MGSPRGPPVFCVELVEMAIKLLLPNPCPRLYSSNEQWHQLSQIYPLHLKSRLMPITPPTPPWQNLWTPTLKSLFTKTILPPSGPLTPTLAHVPYTQVIEITIALATVTHAIRNSFHHPSDPFPAPLDNSVRDPNPVNDPRGEKLTVLNLCTEVARLGWEMAVCNGVRQQSGRMKEAVGGVFMSLGYYYLNSGKYESAKLLFGEGAAVYF